MAQPNARELVVRGPLQNVSIAYRNAAYIASRVAPAIMGVTAKSKILKYLKGAWFRDEAAMRGPGGRAVRGGFPTGFVNITPVEYAFGKEVTDEDRKAVKQQGGPPLKPDEDALRFCADRIDLNKEVRTANVVLTGTWSGVAGEDAAGLWAPNDATNTFIADVEARIQTIKTATGFKPNRMLITGNTLEKVKQLDAVLDRIKYTEKGIVSAPLLAAMFDLEEVLIADAIKSTAKEKKDGTDFTSASIWEKNAGKGSAFLFYAPNAPGLKTPSALYTGIENYGDGRSRRVTTWREAAEHQDVYEVAESNDIVIAAADMGFLWYDTILT